MRLFGGRGRGGSKLGVLAALALAAAVMLGTGVLSPDKAQVSHDVDQIFQIDQAKSWLESTWEAILRSIGE